MKISKKAFLGIVLIGLSFNILAQVGIGTSNPHVSAALEIQSTSKGFLFPRMTEVARDAISNIATGLTIYCTDCGTSGEGVLQVYNASNWEDLNDFVSASTGGMFTEKVGIGTTPIYALDVDANDKGSSTYSARFTNSAEPEDKNLYNIVLFTQGESDTAIGYLGTGGSGVLNAAFKKSFVVGTKNNSPLVLNTNDTERMRIDANGNVGIGTDDCDGYKLKVNGEIHATSGTANSWTSTSDRRWKKKVHTLDNSLDKIATLRGVSYLWRVDDFPNKNFSDGTQLGVIAQEIEAVFPELVHTDKKGYKSVQYSNIVAPLIEAIKTLKHQNEAQQDQITSLIKRVKALEDK